jgi:hypothetical protein
MLYKPETACIFDKPVLGLFINAVTKPPRKEPEIKSDAAKAQTALIALADFYIFSTSTT